MFGKPPREPQKPETPNLKDVKLTPKTVVDLNSQQDTLVQPKANTTNEQSELVRDTPPWKDGASSDFVNTVEKISRIVSPYFVVIVGLALYKNNFLIGGILIIVGILSLFKVTTKDVAAFFEGIKNFFGFN